MTSWGADLSPDYRAILENCLWQFTAFLGSHYQLFRPIPLVRYHVRTCTLDQAQTGSARPKFPSQEYGLGAITDSPRETSNLHSSSRSREKHIRCWGLRSGKENKVENIIMPLCKFRVHFYPEHVMRFWCPHQSGYVRMGKVEKG